MTGRQTFLQRLYPLVMRLSRFAGKKASRKLNTEHRLPVTSFYQLTAHQIDGKRFDFEALKGKKVLVVNTASDCGFTGQYARLQQLFEQYQGTLSILGFPSNQFGEQEKGSEKEISEFCAVNYGVSFPIMQKTNVLPGFKQHPLFAWLSHREFNGWNDTSPVWNFSKYLVDESGTLIGFFGPAIDPFDPVILQSIAP